MAPANCGAADGSVWSQLSEALLLEPKYQVALQLPVHSQKNGDELTMGMRDGSAQVLRCLKVWYELPSDVLLGALNMMDRFLSRMRVRPRHLSCIAISCLLMAARYHHPQQQQQERQQQQAAAGSSRPVVSACHLAAISQAQCSAGDVERMCAIIGDKLGCDPAAAGTWPLTACHWLRLLLRALHQLQQLPATVDEEQLQLRLESVLCCGRAASLRSCELALALLVESQPVDQLQQQQLQLSDSALHRLLQVCRVSEASFAASRRLVVQLLANYETAGSTPRRHRQRLLWRLSHRTLRQLRPTNRLHSLLPTIEESRDGSVSRTLVATAAAAAAASASATTATASAATSSTATANNTYKPVKCRHKRRTSRHPRRNVSN